MPRKADNAWQAFGPAWFAEHQRGLLWLANAPAVAWLFRWILRIHRDVPSGETIHRLLPHAVFYGQRLVWARQGFRVRQIANFRTHWKFSKRLYFAFKPIWWMLHAWDALVADRWVPEWSGGFTTLTARPNPNPETETVDGFVERSASDMWADIHDGAGNDVYSDTASGVYGRFFHGGGGVWTRLGRSIFLFNTAAIPDTSTINTAALHLFGTSKTHTMGVAFTLNVFSANPASNTNLVGSDYGAFGTTALAEAIVYADFSTTAYNVFDFNPAGRATVSLSGVSKFGVREATYDAPNVEPSAATSTEATTAGYFADEAGTTKDPKLVVTYDAPPPAGTMDHVDVITYYNTPGTALQLLFPINDTNRNLLTGVTGKDSEYVSWSIGETPGAFADCSAEAVEVGASGWYTLASVAGENAKDFNFFRIQSIEGLTQYVLVITGIPAQVAAGIPIPTTAQIADKVLGRNIAGSADSSPSVREALWTMRGQIVLDTVGLTITVKDTAGTTIWSGPITLAARGGIITVAPTS